MILDWRQFVAQGQPRWREFATFLTRLENEPALRLHLEEIERFHYLYERTSADLVKIGGFSVEPATRRELESLVARAYGQIHGQRIAGCRWRKIGSLFGQFPRTVRKHARALGLAILVFFIGGLFGGMAVALDDEAKDVIMPWSHLQMDPSERVAQEEKQTGEQRSNKTAFSTFLMTHNTKVSIFVLAAGMTYGIGTLILTFYNGVILGAVGIDYLRAGETEFLLGWLLPHGSIEIPAILIAAQAGLVLAAALLGQSGLRPPLGQRLRAIQTDLVTLIAGVALMLVWAGLIEAFFSQYHEPVLPYSVKIAWGLVQLGILVFYLVRGGRQEHKP